MRGISSRGLFFKKVFLISYHMVYLVFSGHCHVIITCMI